MQEMVGAALAGLDWFGAAPRANLLGIMSLCIPVTFHRQQARDGTYVWRHDAASMAVGVDFVRYGIDMVARNASPKKFLDALRHFPTTTVEPLQSVEKVNIAGVDSYYVHTRNTNALRNTYFHPGDSRLPEGMQVRHDGTLVATQYAVYALLRTPGFGIFYSAVAPDATVAVSVVQAILRTIYLDGMTWNNTRA